MEKPDLEATLTIAISAKNAKGLIEGCLDSINQQTVKPDEILVVVDSVDDNTIEAVKNYPVKICFNEGIKLYHARNTALKNCHSNILAFTDADCVLEKHWVQEVKNVFRQHPEVVAGTGKHPMIGNHNFSSWLHHMWFVVETNVTGYTSGVIGGNSYFKVDVLNEIGGWLKLNLMAAEDVYISEKIKQKGYKIWFDDKIIARHHYKKEFCGFVRQTVMMGHDIFVMLKKAQMYNYLFYYTLCIPLVASLALLCGVLILVKSIVGLILLMGLLMGSYFYLLVLFKNIGISFTRWIARWIIIWPYSFGIIKGMISKND